MQHRLLNSQTHRMQFQILGTKARTRIGDYFSSIRTKNRLMQFRILIRVFENDDTCTVQLDDAGVQLDDASEGSKSS
ncbi:hypothetical protein L2E82_36258 [Cichorium intybus]|uniref:Uncharacterized protein n=1 Tax=Cichorium intybus TaxID=13427 RepID=A0ACB9BRF3_CICIN|nr:hypothetical protein L2E82_36258 [Cichorium intybus]